MLNNSNHLFFTILIIVIGAFIGIISFIWIIIYIYNKLLIQRKLHQETQLNHQKELMVAMLQSQEDERKRIGMDLHDEVGSPLSLIKMLIGDTKTHQTALYLQQCKTLVNQVITSVRRICHNLSPLREGIYELNDALEDLRDSVNETGQIQLDLYMPHGELVPHYLGHPLSLALYRVINELVNNSLKHSQASMIQLSINLIKNGLTIFYQDNGIGLGQTIKMGNGLKNIESRLSTIGAQYNWGNKNKGFNLTIHLKK